MLETLKGEEMAAKAAVEVTSADPANLSARLGRTRQPQTVQNYLSHLAAVCAVARPAFNLDVDRHAMKGAKEATKRLGPTAKSAERGRRPALAEIDWLTTHLVERSRRRNAWPM